MKAKQADLEAKDARILAAFREFERADPAGELITLTAQTVGVTEDRVMDALEREADQAEAMRAPVVLPAGVRRELIGDVALQFEQMDHPMSLGWFQERGVTLAEARALSRWISDTLRAAMGSTTQPTDPENPAETTLGQRAQPETKPRK